MEPFRRSALALVLGGATLFSGAVAADPVNGKNLRNPIAQLQAMVDELTVRVADLETNRQTIEQLHVRVEALEAENTTLQARLACISTASNSWDLFLDGCNVHVRDGTGGSDSTSGLGNLLIGYDEGIGGKTGTHNLVVGPNHQYTSWGGVVFGRDNRTTAPSASALGGSGITVNHEGSWGAGAVADNATGFTVDALNVTMVAAMGQTLRAGSTLMLDSGALTSISSDGNTRIIGAGSTRVEGALVRINDGSRPAARLGDHVINGVIIEGAPTVLLP